MEGDKDRHGELFGLENLFSYRAEGASLSKDIVKRTEKLEAGFKVTKYEIVPEEKSEEGLEDEVGNDSFSYVIICSYVIIYSITGKMACLTCHQWRSLKIQ